MRLKRTQDVLKGLGIRFKYIEKDSLGKIYIGDKIIYEHYANWKKTTTFIMAEEINLINETQLIGWIRTNEDRLKRNNRSRETR